MNRSLRVVETGRRPAGVRPLAEDDIPQVTRLHQTVFGVPQPVDAGWYHEYFTRVFLDEAGGPRPSLVYQNEKGRILGFLGLVPRRLVLNGRAFNAVISSQFVVDPMSQVGLVALRLAKTYLDGPQDISIADEANDVSRRIWEGLGGTTALLYSLYWTRPLRPARLAVSHLRQRRGFEGVAAAAGPMASAADALATRLPGSYFRQSAPSTSCGVLSGSVALAHASELCGPAALRVEYDEGTFEQLLESAAVRNVNGRLLTATVTRGGKLLGWYVSYLDESGVADVAQLAATPSSVHEVLRHLFHDMWREGAIAVTGRMDPRFVQALSDAYCLFHRRGPWVLIRARAPELLNAFHAGHSTFSRFDGEWSLRFPVRPPRSTASC